MGRYLFKLACSRFAEPLANALAAVAKPASESRFGLV
jgi:hypothetical protein